MPENFRQYAKCLITQIACNIYTPVKEMLGVGGDCVVTRGVRRIWVITADDRLINASMSFSCLCHADSFDYFSMNLFEVISFSPSSFRNRQYSSPTITPESHDKHYGLQRITHQFLSLKTKHTDCLTA